MSTVEAIVILTPVVLAALGLAAKALGWKKAAETIAVVVEELDDPSLKETIRIMSIRKGTSKHVAVLAKKAEKIVKRL